MRIVLDTSALVAAVRSRNCASRQLLIGGFLKNVTLLLSVPLILEYEAVLTRPEHLAAFGGTEQDIKVLLDAIGLSGERVNRMVRLRPLLRDADDEMVLETAISGNADAIVTFNRRDFEPAATDLAIALLTPSQALDRWISDEKNLVSECC